MKMWHFLLLKNRKTPMSSKNSNKNHINSKIYIHYTDVKFHSSMGTFSFYSDTATILHIEIKFLLILHTIKTCTSEKEKTSNKQAK